MTIITRESLPTLEAYAKFRKSSQPDIIAHRKLRTVRLGEHISVQFEDERTIQEMQHIEKIFDEESIQMRDRGLRAARARWPQLEGDHADRVPRRARAQARVGAAHRRGDRMFVELEGYASVYAIADEDLERENGEKTSAVHPWGGWPLKRPMPYHAFTKAGVPSYREVLFARASRKSINNSNEPLASCLR